MSVGIWRRSYNKQLTSKLTEEGEAHTDWTDFGLGNLRNVTLVSQKVLQKCQLNVFGDFDIFNLNSPLEGQIKVYKEDTESISLFVVPAYWAVIAARQDVEMIMPTKPIM